MRGVPEWGLPSAPWEEDSIPAADGSWTSPKSPSPRGHFFLPPGVFLHRSDLPETVKGNNVTLHLDQNATRRSEEDPRFWLVPLDIQILWTRICTGPETDLLCRFMEQLFSEGIQVGDDRHLARHYLSSQNLHVFDVKDIVAQPAQQRDGWETRLLVSMTFFCSGRKAAA
jgi:hypothetical protein